MTKIRKKKNSNRRRQDDLRVRPPVKPEKLLKVKADCL